MQSRYSKPSPSGAISGSSSHFGRSGASALSLYTNNTPNKRSTSSGYTSDHYASPSSLHSLPGYGSDVCGSHVSKGSYQSNPYGSSSGLKGYSGYGMSSGAMSRNLSSTLSSTSANKSRVPSITYSYSSGYARNLSPTASKYGAYNSRSSSASQNTFSAHFDNNNNTKNRNNEVKASNKAPADFTSDSEDSDVSEVEMRGHTNVIFTSRATSPNPHTSHTRIDSISSTQQIIRPKKVVFGLSSKKDCKQTQVTEQELTDTQILRNSVSPVRSPMLSPCRSLTPTYTPTPTLSPIHSPSQSPSPVRMRYGCTPNRRPNSGSNFNRYSMPIITNTNTATDYSNYDTNADSKYSHTENRISAQPSQSNETQSFAKENSFSAMPVISEINDTNNTNDSSHRRDTTGDTREGTANSDQNNNTLLAVESKSPPHRRSIVRLSPSAIRRRRSQSRNKLSGRSRSRSRERFLDREESSTTLTSSSEDEDNRSGSDRHLRTKKKRISTKNDETQYKAEGFEELQNQPKNTSIDIPIPNRDVDSPRKNRSKGSTNESSSSPEKVIIKRPSLKSPELIGPTVVITRLPMKIKDPYSTETECEDNEQMDECDNQKKSDPIAVVTVRLTPSPELSKTPTNVVPQRVERQGSDSCELSSESSDNSCQSVRPNNKDKESLESAMRAITDGTAKEESLLVTNCDEKNDPNDTSGAFRDNHMSILSDFERNERKGSERMDDSQDRNNCSPFPKQDNDLRLECKQVAANAIDATEALSASVEVNASKRSNTSHTSNASHKFCSRDSGFAEVCNRPDSPYDNLKPIDDCNKTVREIHKNIDSNESVSPQKQFISEVNDIDSLLTGLEQQSFGELERKFQNDATNAAHNGTHGVRTYCAIRGSRGSKEEARDNLSLFISKCQDIDEMIDPLCPTSPLSPNQTVFNSTPFRNPFANIEEEDCSVAVDACQVKVHNSEAMKSTVICFALTLVSNV